jgi:hypothetical protein
VVRVHGEQRLEDRARLHEVRVGQVVRRRRLRERQRVEDHGLHVLGVARGEGGHRVAVGDHARVLVPVLGITVQLGGCGDVGLLALARDGGTPGPIDRLLTPLDLRR